VKKRLRPDNPVHGVLRFADGKRDRRLSDQEYKMLGKALADAQLSPIWPAAVAAAWFLALTGWRSGEVLNLLWTDVDLRRRTAILPDTKTGRSVRPLSRRACDLLQGLARTGDRVFPASRGPGPMTGFPKFWARIATPGGLPEDITPHVLRHSYASLASDLGYSEPTIAALVGHKGNSMTSRYIHAADMVLLAAADVIADETYRRMGNGVDGKPLTDDSETIGRPNASS
jgi:integrase